MVPNTDALFVDDALLRQGEQFCRQRVDREPGNCAARRSLAEIYRKEGKLAQAAAAYEEVLRVEPDDAEAGYLHAVLSGGESARPPRGMCAAPFVLLRNFLPPDFHQSLLPLLIAVQQEMTPINTAATGDYAADSRQALEFRGEWDRQRFRAAFRQQVIPLLSRLHLPPFTIGLIEIVMRAYQDGHYFKVHRDAEPNSPFADRIVNFVYFFHRVPRPYAGGDLLLFDSDLEANTCTKSRFTRIVPEDNTMIVFPCNFYHCVVPVHCASREFIDSRFVINGHLRTR
jgi:Rps23 Pro-64 3,4-dihydroxylase Tpa1-like proline 4-hydroxylase